MSQKIKLGCWFVSMAVAVSAAAGVSHGQDTLKTQLAPFLQQHCLECHSGDAPESGLNLETDSAQLTDADVRRRWVFLLDRVASGEMPPNSQPQPGGDDKRRFLKLLGDSLAQADLEGREIVLRRLNRNEYENTVRDLFGIHVDLQRVLPDDSTELGFDNVGSDLSVSAEQMVLYVEAADLVLDQVFGPDREPRHLHKKIAFKDFRVVDRADRMTPEGGIVFGSRPIPVWNSSVSVPASYRVRITAKAVHSDQPVVMRVNGGVTGSIAPHVAGFFEVPPGEFTTIELIDRARESSDNYEMSFDAGSPHWTLDVDAYKGPGLLIQGIEVEGPLEDWPPPSRRQLLGEVDPASGTLEDIRAILRRMIPQAFRRAVNEQEIEPYVALAKNGLDQGLTFEKGLRRGLKGVLCAPEFLFMEESIRSDSRQQATIDDFALASRLSYFLWSSKPDQELFTLAQQGELQTPDVLRMQIQRMLGDPKSQRFVENFTDQWLRLRDIDFTVPDRRLYPEYTQLLRKSMLDETRAFFREVLDHDLSVQNFIDSDFAMINQPLAEHYGIDGITGLEIRRVVLPPGSLRGGVLTQASVLKVSADGTRTSPVLRGAWIQKHFLGTPSPPPPPSVSAVEPDIRGATTIRQQLAQHRDHASCDRCHRKIDPPGFALETFDVIGQQRQWYRTRNNGKYVQRTVHPHSAQNVQYKRGLDVDSAGSMPDGRPFADVREYKRLLMEDKTLATRTLTRMLLSYALGRRLGFSDRPEVQRIVASVKDKNDGLRSIVHEVVHSEAFRSP